VSTESEAARNRAVKRLFFTGGAFQPQNGYPVFPLTKKSIAPVKAMPGQGGGVRAAGTDIYPIKRKKGRR
jgi:hypothetical protein